MEKTSIGKILDDLDEQRKLKKAPRTLHDYYVKLITRGVQDKKEKEKIKNKHKNRNGHYEIDIYYRPYFSAIFQGYDKGLEFYKKIIQLPEDATFEEIKEAFESALKIFEQECINDEHIQSMIFKYDEFTGYSLRIALENIDGYLDAIVMNTYEMTYLQRVQILKNVEDEFKTSIFPETVLLTVLNSVGDKLKEMGVSEENIKKEFSKVLKNQ